jgi:hypothetical protein
MSHNRELEKRIRRIELDIEFRDMTANPEAVKYGFRPETLQGMNTGRVYLLAEFNDLAGVKVAEYRVIFK